MSSNIYLKLQLTENVEQETQEANLLMALMETKLEHKCDIGLHVTDKNAAMKKNLLKAPIGYRW